MCGRIDVDAEIVKAAVHGHCQIEFDVLSNHDLRPTQPVDVLVALNNSLKQQRLTWGIQPEWAKRILINAQAETVATKRTFKNAFRQHRCIVPCSGWYEWRQEEGKSKKTKYRFFHEGGDGLFMAGIYYPSTDNESRLVTLTTSPTEQCRPYHDRMPLLLKPEEIHSWLAQDSGLLEPLLNTSPEIPIMIQPA